MKANSKMLLVSLTGIMFVVLSAIFTPVSCYAHDDDFVVAGNGKIVAQNYSVTKQPFSAIYLDLGDAGDMQAQVTHQPHTADAVITTDSNLLSYIKVYIKNETLYIIRKDDVDLKPSNKIKIVVNTENLDSVNTRGEANVILQGETKNLTLEMHGSGNINAKKLNAEKVRAIIQGSGDIIANATQKISAEIHGSGKIEYYGNPPQVERVIHGSGKIKALR
jgi:hypothetical protein